MIERVTERVVTSRERTATGRILRTYLLFVVIPILCVLFALFSAPVPSPGLSTADAGHDVGEHLLIAVAVVILAACVGGWLAKRAGQPPVIGEILVGVALGPSLLGTVWSSGQAWLFPSSVSPVLTGLAELGLVVLMFLTGREINLDDLRRNWQGPGLVAQAAIAGPFLGGVLLAMWLYGTWAGPHASPVVFQLFLGCAMSITALPVLARILTARGMTEGKVGQLSLTVAAIGDAVTWCLVAVIVAVAGNTPLAAARTAFLTVAFGLLVLCLGQPILTRLLARLDRTRAPAPVQTAALLLGLVCCAYATSTIGITAIFGAFLFGLACPSHPAVTALTTQLTRYACPVLLPFFFVKTGLATDIPYNHLGWAILGVTAAVLMVATVTKATGAYVAARSITMGRAASARLAILLNARGLTELVLLDLGRRLGIIGEQLFVVLVLVTLVTTCAAAPLLDMVDRRQRRRLLPAKHLPSM